MTENIAPSSSTQVPIQAHKFKFKYTRKRVVSFARFEGQLHGELLIIIKLLLTMEWRRQNQPHLQLCDDDAMRRRTMDNKQYRRWRHSPVAQRLQQRQAQRFAKF